MKHNYLFVFLFVCALSLFKFSTNAEAGVPGYVKNCWGGGLCGGAEEVGRRYVELLNESYQENPGAYPHLCGPVWYYTGVSETIGKITIYTHRTQTCVGPHDLYAQLTPWCPSGYEYGQIGLPNGKYPFVCKAIGNNPENQLGPTSCDEISPYVGNPCNSATGNKYHSEADFSSVFDGGITFYAIIIHKI